MNARLLGVLAAMVALLGAGLATGTRAYYLLLCLLLLTLLFSLASALITLFSVRVSMKGVRPRMNRGDRLMTLLTVHHSCVLPVGNLWVTLNVPGSAGGRQEIGVNAPPFVQRQFRHVIRCPHRGNYEVGVERIGVSDLFSLFEFSRASGKRLMRVEVCPRPSAQPLMPLKASDVGPEFISRAAEDNASPSGVRKWQDGDELKKVHWKLTLKKREVMVRTFEESARPDTLIIPDLSEIAALNDQKLTLEDAICESALGAAKAQLEGGFPVCMPLQAAQPQELSARTAAELPAFSEALTRVAFDGPYPYEQILMLMMGRFQRTGGAVLITSRLTGRTADIAIRMQNSGVQVKFIWVSESGRSEALEMLERIRMSGALVQQLDPWAGEVPAAAPDAADVF